MGIKFVNNKYSYGIRKKQLNGFTVDWRCIKGQGTPSTEASDIGILGIYRATVPSFSRAQDLRRKDVGIKIQNYYNYGPERVSADLFCL